MTVMQMVPDLNTEENRQYLQFLTQPAVIIAVNKMDN